jgi:hypothetical protein
LDPLILSGLLAAGAAIALVALLPRVRRWIASTRAAIVLLLLIAAFAALGVGIGQNLPTAAYVDRYGRVLGLFVVRSGLSDVFHAWYFAFAVGALGLSVLTCTWRRIVPTALSRKVARLPKIGSLLTHVAIALVLAGGFVTALGGFQYPAGRFLAAGDTIDVPEGGFTLRVDEATMEFTEDGALAEYVSVVTVLENGDEILSRRIEVNHPLVHRGVGVYQYEMLPSPVSVDEAYLAVIVRSDEGVATEVGVRAGLNETVDLAGTSLSLKILAFLSDFTYDIERGAAELASTGHDNPAVLVQVSRDDRVLGERWVFAASAGHPERELPVRLFLLDYRPDFRNCLTRFEFARQPGTPLLYTGFLVMSLGLCLALWGRSPGTRDLGSRAGRPREAEPPNGSRTQLGGAEEE